MKRAASICCQCHMCTDMCPRFNLGHPIQPHMFMRATSNHDFQDTNPYLNTFFCCSCGVCEMYACPQSLAPRSLMLEFKGGLRKNGVKPPQVTAKPVHDGRELRKVPEERLMARLGLSRYDKPAPLNDTVAAVKKVTVKLSQHIGAPAQAVVKKGDIVTAGQVIAKPADKALSVAIHASISGRVADVNDQTIVIVA